MPDSSTILLVDDEDAVQKLLAYPLERDGFRVLQARDGQEALERFAREHVDLVVLDVMLPKLDGLEVCKRLRAASAVPIIMLTARDDELDKVLGLELGADDYITKPFSIREFRSRVRAVLRRAAVSRSALVEEEVISANGLMIDVGRRTVELGHDRVQLAQLRDAAPAIAAQYESKSAVIDPQPVLQAASESASARISVFTRLDPQTLIPVADSNLASSSDLAQDPIAERSAARGVTVSGTVERRETRYAEVARLLPKGDVLLLSASLHDSLANIHLVRRRLLIAGLIALVASLLVGYGAASIFARRLRRLERAADRIAGGDFSEPVSDSGSDEVGQLAEAFERMRQRLSGLERARREFIANASHELRTPLFSLGGFLELLENEELDPATQDEFLRAMREQIDRLTKLATELLDLSRLYAGRVHVEAEPLDLESQDGRTAFALALPVAHRDDGDAIPRENDPVPAVG